MKKLLLLALLVVGCENSTEPEDCAGVAGGSAEFDAIAICGGSCVADADADGLCDTLQGSVTDIDGNIYKTIIIGTQTWMAENLKTTKYKDGTDIPTGHSNSDWSNLTTGAYAVYDNSFPSAFSYIAYEKFYNWFAIEQSQGICMEGWHIPTDDEWTVLTDYLGGSSIAGGKMKSAGNNDWLSIEEANSSGFSAHPVGYRPSDGSYSFYGTRTIFWSSTEIGTSIGTSSYAWNRQLIIATSDVSRETLNNKQNGLSIRCLKD